MDHVVEITDRKNPVSKTALHRLLSWYFIAALAFIGVVLFHQFMVGTVSYLLGYQTHIHFGKVDSLPAINRFWSSTRVLALYALPSALLLFLSLFILLALLFAPKNEIEWRWTAFWVMVFSALMGTTELSISLISALTSKGSLYQGYAVITSWFGLSLTWSIGFIILSGLINISFGFICSPALLDLAPPDFIVKKISNTHREIVLNTFVYPILLLVPIAALLSYPGYLSFFAVMFFHACLWFPGLFSESKASVNKRRSRGKSLESHSNYLLVGLTVLLVIIIRIFFS
jgi:hypothetical protein